MTGIAKDAHPTVAAFEALRAAAERVRGLAGLEAVMNAFVASACEYLAADGGGVAVMNPIRGRLEVASSTLGEARLHAPQKGISALAFTRREVVVVEDLDSRPEAIAALEPPYASAVAIPLMLAGEPVGSFGVAYREPHRFTDTEIGFLELLGFQITQYIHAADLSADLDTTRKQISAIVQSAPIVVYSIDLEGRVILSEGAGLERLGLRSGELVGRSMFDLYGGYPEVIDSLRRGLAGESGEVVLETDGSFFANRFQPLRDGAGVVVGLSGVGFDVTEQVRSAAENAAKSRFLATMSHEMRTPLNAILGFTQLLETKTFGPLNERQSRYIDNIMSSGRHLLELVNDTLDLARVVAGELDLALVEVPVAAIIGEVVDRLNSLASSKGLAVSFEADTDLIAVADQRRYSQIVINLLGNAIKFTESGTIRVVAGREGETVVTRVVDTGIGIGADDSERIFEDFVQLQGVAGRTAEGTGLGLALSRRLARAMGGTLTVESVLGAGSTFTVTLPLAMAAR